MCRKSSYGPVFVLLVAVWAGCGVPEDRVSVDVRYSEYLTVLSREYLAISSEPAAATVSAVQIIESVASDATTLTEATRGNLVYESRDRVDIEVLFGLLQSDGSIGECDLGEENPLLLVAYDRDIPRAALIRLYACTSEEGSLIGIRPIGDAAIDYSAAAVGYLNQLRVLKPR